MTKISKLTRQLTISTNDLFLVNSVQNDDNILITGTNMLTSLDVVTNANLSAVRNSKTNRVVTANNTLTDTDELILGDVSGGDFTINLIKAALVTNRIFNFKKTDNSANTITLQPDGSELIDSNATATLVGVNRVFMSIYSDGSNWHIIS